MTYSKESLIGQIFDVQETTVFDRCNLSGSKVTTNGYSVDTLNCTMWGADIDGYKYPPKPVGAE